MPSCWWCDSPSTNLGEPSPACCVGFLKPGLGGRQRALSGYKLSFTGTVGGGWGGGGAAPAAARNTMIPGSLLIDDPLINMSPTHHHQPSTPLLQQRPSRDTVLVVAAGVLLKVLSHMHLQKASRKDGQLSHVHFCWPYFMTLFLLPSLFPWVVMLHVLMALNNPLLSNPLQK